MRVYYRDLQEEQKGSVHMFHTRIAAESMHEFCAHIAKKYEMKHFNVFCTNNKVNTKYVVTSSEALFPFCQLLLGTK